MLLYSILSEFVKGNIRSIVDLLLTIKKVDKIANLKELFQILTDKIYCMRNSPKKNFIFFRDDNNRKNNSPKIVLNYNRHSKFLYRLRHLIRCAFNLALSIIKHELKKNPTLSFLEQPPRQSHYR